MKTDTNYPPTAPGAPVSSLSAGEAVSPNIHSAAEQPHTSSESLSPRAQGTHPQYRALDQLPGRHAQTIFIRERLVLGLPALPL